jgi:hypothetical protein
MRLSLALAPFLLAELSSAFFVAPSQNRRNVALFESSEANAEKKPTTAADILAKARKAAGIPDEEEAPKIFEDDLMEDMQKMLLTLEKRVRDGPGSVSLLEVEDLQARSKRVLVDMKAKETDRLSGVGYIAPPAAPPAVAATQAPPAPEVVKSPAMDEEGPEYDGTGGMGLAKGTVNTYFIPGMDEMSPDEYQKALQKSVSDRQANRHKSGVTGNRATWDYLQHLSGESGVLKKEEYEKKDESGLGSDRVLVDTKAKETDILKGVGSAAPPAAKPITAAPPAAPPAPAVVATPAPPAQEVIKAPAMNEDGPEYDGTGGMGLATGTVNTYFIPGMDEMSPDEYQKALQKSVSDRQANRHKSGVTGNRATWDYLQHLSGESGVLKKEEYEKKEE